MFIGVFVPFFSTLRGFVADSVDYLNYYVTSLILAFFALAISAKQYFGSPIQCWVPSEFRGGWEKYAEDYCFIANSYYVPFNEEIPSDIDHRRDHISYYRWVPIMLALQAVMFFIPNWIWNMLHKQTGAYFLKILQGYTAPRSGCNATLLYLLTKAAYVVNICLQIIILNHFLGENYLQWGYEVSGKKHPFFRIRRLANLQRHTVQCVIMMNMINEKLYLFLYFWLVFILELLFLRSSIWQFFGITLHFMQECLHPDGVLLLLFVREHAGGRIAFDLISKVYAIFCENDVSVFPSFL
ncbi:unnamed protein product [Angiostrongylus costaricensis]|uniref:Innexin n=1 Tax=Angiostrongylus costaricensis TaxID=334426 RepID=A0A3P7J9F6_ANGCS|nr:unnamed protein product [Angiostrongylus costaricensis]